MAIRNHSKRPAWVAQRMDEQVKKRTGVTRHTTSITILGVPVVKLIGAPETLRERWYKKPRGRRYHFSIKRFVFQARDGQYWSALRAQTHDGDHGYCLSVTGFWNLKPAQNSTLPK